MGAVTVIIGRENLRELCAGDQETRVKDGRILIKVDMDIGRA